MRQSAKDFLPFVPSSTAFEEKLPANGFVIVDCKASDREIVLKRWYAMHSGGQLLRCCV